MSPEHGPGRCAHHLAPDRRGGGGVNLGVIGYIVQRLGQLHGLEMPAGITQLTIDPDWYRNGQEAQGAAGTGGPNTTYGGVVTTWHPAPP